MQKASSAEFAHLHGLAARYRHHVPAFHPVSQDAPSALSLEKLNGSGLQAAKSMFWKMDRFGRSALDTLTNPVVSVFFGQRFSRRIGRAVRAAESCSR